LRDVPRGAFGRVPLGEGDDPRVGFQRGKERRLRRGLRAVAVTCAPSTLVTEPPYFQTSELISAMAFWLLSRSSTVTLMAPQRSRMPRRMTGSP
jgi:hypothetical protein